MCAQRRIPYGTNQELAASVFSSPGPPSPGILGGENYAKWLAVSTMSNLIPCGSGQAYLQLLLNDPNIFQFVVSVDNQVFSVNNLTSGMLADCISLASSTALTVQYQLTEHGPWSEPHQVYPIGQTYLTGPRSGSSVIDSGGHYHDVCIDYEGDGAVTTAQMYLYPSLR